MALEIDLSGRTVIITGAAQGIGEAIALVAAQAGAKLVLVDVNGAALQGLAERLGADNVLVLAGSVTGTGNDAASGGSLTDIFFQADSIKLSGRAEFAMTRQTVDVDTDGNGTADLLGARLDAIALSVSNAKVTVANVATVRVSGELAVAQVSPAGAAVNTFLPVRYSAT